MKTINKGKPWSKKVKCTGHGNGSGGCGAQLLIEKEDLYETSRECYGDSSPTYYTTFACQECGVETDIEVPDHISDKLVSKATYLKNKKMEKNGTDN